MPFGINWTPRSKWKTFIQLYMTGQLWTESRKEDAWYGAGSTYFLATSFMWMPPVIKSTLVWNPITKGYLLGASITVGVIGALEWLGVIREGSTATALDFYTDPLDTPAKTTWALKEITKKEQTWDRELAEFFLNGVGLQSKSQRDQALLLAEVEASRSEQEAMRLYQESIVMGSFTEPYDLYRYGYIDIEEYLYRLETMRASSHKAKLLKAQWNSLSKTEQKKIVSTRRAMEGQQQLLFQSHAW